MYTTGCVCVSKSLHPWKSHNLRVWGPINQTSLLLWGFYEGEQSKLSGRAARVCVLAPGRAALDRTSAEPAARII